MATSYYYESHSSKGILAISSNVFENITQSAIDNMVNGPLKGKIQLTSGRKKAGLTINIGARTVVINVQVFASVEGEKLDETFAELQKAIYEAIYDATEISSVKVNISLLGFVK